MLLKGNKDRKDISEWVYMFQSNCKLYFQRKKLNQRVVALEVHVLYAFFVSDIKGGH